MTAVSESSIYRAAVASGIMERVAYQDTIAEASCDVGVVPQRCSRLR